MRGAGSPVAIIICTKDKKSTYKITKIQHILCSSFQKAIGNDRGIDEKRRVDAYARVSTGRSFHIIEVMDIPFLPYLVFALEKYIHK